MRARCLTASVVVLTWLGCATTADPKPAPKVEPAAPAPQPPPAAPPPAAEPPPPEPSPPPSCAQLVSALRLARQHHQWPQARHALEQYRPRCASHPSVDMEEAHMLEATGHPALAAQVLAQTVTQPGMPPQAFELLVALWPRLLPEALARQQILALGTQMDAPVYLPRAALESLWLQHFTCPTGPARLKTQQRVVGPQGRLDALEIQCPDGAHGTRYFDTSAEERD